MTKKDKEKGKARAEALDARLARLEAALAAIEPGAPEPGGAPADGPPGRIRLSVRLDGTDWRQDTGAAALLAADWPARAARLAALGHPVRLAILRAALDGPVQVAELIAASGAGSPGQFYHHLRELTAAGWLKPLRRGSYGVPPGRAGALLAAVALAGEG